MNWAYLWMAGYGVACIILSVVFLLSLMSVYDWVEQGGLTRINKKIHWQRTKREEVLRDLGE